MSDNSNVVDLIIRNSGQPMAVYYAAMMARDKADTAMRLYLATDGELSPSLRLALTDAAEAADGIRAQAAAAGWELLP